MKRLTRDQIQARKEKAVRFTRDVLGDPDRADEIAAEDLDSYALRKHVEIANPTNRSSTVPRTKTKADLESEIDDLRSENQELQEDNVELQDQLDSIADIVSPSDEDEDEDEEDEDDTSRD
jgi:Skp family chaperone for outer membrane proteins